MKLKEAIEVAKEFQHCSLDCNKYNVRITYDQNIHDSIKRLLAAGRNELRKKKRSAK